MVAYSCDISRSLVSSYFTRVSYVSRKSLLSSQSGVKFWLLKAILKQPHGTSFPMLFTCTEWLAMMLMMMTPVNKRKSDHIPWWISDRQQSSSLYLICERQAVNCNPWSWSSVKPTQKKYIQIARYNTIQYKVLF